MTTTTRDFTTARVAYEGYCRQTGWKSLATGQDLPEFESLKPEIKEAWAASANHLLRTTIDIKAGTEIQTLSDQIHSNARSKGFYEQIDELLGHPALTPEQKHFIKILWFSNRLMLVTSELGEALEGLRHGNYSDVPASGGVGEELADAAIRMFDLSLDVRKELDGEFELGAAMRKKMAYNATRAHKHGNKAV